MTVEFIACYEASNHGIWLRNFVTGLRIMDGIERQLKLFCDNKLVVLYSNNNRSSTKYQMRDLKKKSENHHTNRNIHIESSRIKILDLRKRT